MHAYWPEKLYGMKGEDNVVNSFEIEV